MLEHGGQLSRVAAQSEIPQSQWLDLSTGINPSSWQTAAPMPIACWQRLPEDHDGLELAAQQYYQAPAVLPVAGSQAAIQALPRLRPACTVAMAAVAYAEHACNWESNGHNLVLIDEKSLSAMPDRLPDNLDVLLLINPCNPTGRVFSTSQLLSWHQQLAARGGWLVVDEAFMDMTPDQSLAAFTDRPGLIVLRSVGKFFGLAGARLGFVLAQPALLAALTEVLGPWGVSGPSRWLLQRALGDTGWQQAMRGQLSQASTRLHQLLCCYGLAPTGGTALFHYCQHPLAASLYDQLLQYGVLVRLFQAPAALRFGLPYHESDWSRLNQILSDLNLKNNLTTKL